MKKGHKPKLHHPLRVARFGILLWVLGVGLQGCGVSSAPASNPKDCTRDENCPEYYFCYHENKICSKCLGLDVCGKMKRTPSGSCVKTKQDCGACISGYMEDKSKHCVLASTETPNNPVDDTSGSGTSPVNITGDGYNHHSNPTPIAFLPYAIAIVATPFAVLCLVYLKKRYQKWRGSSTDLQGRENLLPSTTVESACAHSSKQTDHSTAVLYNRQSPYYEPFVSFVATSRPDQPVASSSFQMAEPFNMGNFGSELQGSGMSPTTPTPSAPNPNEVLDEFEEDGENMEVLEAFQEPTSTSTDDQGSSAIARDPENPDSLAVEEHSSGETPALNTPSSRNSSIDSGRSSGVGGAAQFQLNFNLQIAGRIVGSTPRPQHTNEEQGHFFRDMSETIYDWSEISNPNLFLVDGSHMSPGDSGTERDTDTVPVVPDEVSRGIPDIARRRHTDISDSDMETMYDDAPLEDDIGQFGEGLDGEEIMDFGELDLDEENEN